MGNLIIDRLYYNVLTIHYVKEPNEDCIVLLSYNPEESMKYKSRESLEKDLLIGDIHPVAEYELYFYNKDEMQKKFFCTEEIEIDTFLLIKEVYLRTGLSLDHVNMNAGNRYAIVQGKTVLDIIYLDFAEGRYHYILTNDFGKRFNKIDKGHYDPKNLKRRKTVNYIKKPIVIGNMGPFWTPNCYKIIAGKVYGKENEYN